MGSGKGLNRIKNLEISNVQNTNATINNQSNIEEIISKIKVIAIDNDYANPLYSVEEQKSLEEYFDLIYPEIKDTITQIEADLPKSFQDIQSLSDFLNNSSFFVNKEEFEKNMYELLLANEYMTYKQNSDSKHLLEPFQITVTQKQAETKIEKMKEKLALEQEKTLENSNKFLKDYTEEMRNIFPGIDFSEDGQADFSNVNMNNILSSPENIYNLVSLFQEYQQNMEKNPYVYKSSSYLGLLEFKNDFLGLGRWPFKKSSAEELSYNIQNNPSVLNSFLYSINKAAIEINRDNLRAKRFLAGERFWPNDESGGFYSHTLEKNGRLGNMIVRKDVFVKMAMMATSSEVEEEGTYYGYKDGKDLLVNHKNKIVKNIIGNILHEYVHKVSQVDGRGQIEQELGISFADFDENIFNPIKKAGPLANMLFHEDYGSYALSSSSEMISEAFRFFYIYPEKREEIKHRFSRLGLDDVYKNLLKFLGL